jgi:hypothetical protein
MRLANGSSRDNLKGLVRRKLGSLNPEARREFAEVFIEGHRIDQVLQWLVEAGYPPQFAHGTFAAQLGFTEAELMAVLGGRSRHLGRMRPSQSYLHSPTPMPILKSYWWRPGMGFLRAALATWFTVSPICTAEIRIT